LQTCISVASRNEPTVNQLAATSSQYTGASGHSLYCLLREWRCTERYLLEAGHACMFFVSSWTRRPSLPLPAELFACLANSDVKRMGTWLPILAYHDCVLIYRQLPWGLHGDLKERLQGCWAASYLNKPLNKPRLYLNNPRYGRSRMVYKVYAYCTQLLSTPPLNLNSCIIWGWDCTWNLRTCKLEEPW
jgi:hypothetical protein